MILTLETIAQIRDMLETSPALVSAIRSCASPVDAAAMLARAASAHGVGVPPLGASTGEHAADQVIPDTALEKISGGKFSVLPPEINSLRMFTGAGSAPLLSAGAAWQSLAADLSASAASFDAVMSGMPGIPGPVIRS
ncbi:PPE domain-containing protein [Polaromonas sp. YR568]|uniref:PPE domain-containing protein n=1 Tax=Polaromonas sp. YR568 TaxID=1855301 RepID=UPI003137F369